MMDYLTDFLDFCEHVRGRSEHTVRSYAWDLGQYFRWLQERGVEVPSIKPMDIDSFIIYLKKQKGNSSVTINHKIYCLKVFYGWLLRNDVIQKNPLRLVDRIKEAKSLPNYLTPLQQEALISASLDGGKAKRIHQYARERSYLLILLLLDCGLRIAEACSLKWENVNFEDGTLKVKGKGEKERIGILSNRLLSALKAYRDKAEEINLKERKRAGIYARGFTLAQIGEQSGIPFSTVVEVAIARRHLCQGKRTEELEDFIDEKIRPLPLRYVIFNRAGKPLNTRQAFRIIRDIGGKAGIKNLYPHLLRHSFAVNLRRKGADTMLLKEALGHSSIITTQIYCGFTNGEFKEKMRQLVN